MINAKMIITLYILDSIIKIDILIIKGLPQTATARYDPLVFICFGCYWLLENLVYGTRTIIFPLCSLYHI